MSKPWAKLELDILDHPKFLALTGNAIALWLEGKNFCDKHQTEGFVPRDAVKRFRFRALRSVALLTTSIGPRVGGQAYAPLWESAAGGYQMHDYLAYNDARTVVEARLEDAAERTARRRTYEREYKQKMRDAKAAKHDASTSLSTCASTMESRVDRPSGPHTVSTIASTSITDPDPETEKREEKKEKSTHTLPRARGSLIQGAHPAHAVCGRVCVPAFLHREFLTAIGGQEDIANQRLWEWYQGIWAALPEGDAVEPDAVKFWRPRFTAQFVKAAVITKTEAQRTVDVAAEIQRQERVAGR